MRTPSSIQQLNRQQNRNDFLTADIKTGAVKRVFRDESPQWVDVIDEVPWVDGGLRCLWQSETRRLPPRLPRAARRR